MADNLIEIGFQVGNDDLEAGMAKAAETVRASLDSIQDSLANLRNTTLLASQPLKNLTDEPAGDTKKIQNDFAAQTAAIEQLKAANRIAADDAIAQELRVEDARFQALRAELENKAEAASGDLRIHQKLQDQADALEAAHNAKVRSLRMQQVRESETSWRSIISPISGAFQSSLNGIIRGNQTLSQAVASMGQSIVTQFADMAVKRATDWIISELTMTTATETGEATRLAAKQSGAAAGKAADAAAGSASIFGDANKAAAGAFAAVVDIPYVGPVLAPIAAGAAFAAVMAYDIFSAKGGYDIPAGLNPITQLHEREMVLPASIADPLRANLAGGGGSGGDIHIHAVDAASFQRLLSNNKGAVAKALRAAARGFDPALSPL